MSKLFLFFLVAFLPASQTLGQNLMEVKGKLASITPREIGIETGSDTYYIDRKAVPEDTTKKLEKVGMEVNLTVSMENITRIQPNKRTPATIKNKK